MVSSSSDVSPFRGSNRGSAAGVSNRFRGTRPGRCRSHRANPPYSPRVAPELIVMVNPASHSNHLALGQVCLSQGPARGGARGIGDRGRPQSQRRRRLRVPGPGDEPRRAAGRGGQPGREGPAPQSRRPALVLVEPGHRALSSPALRRSGRCPAARQAAQRHGLPLAGGCLRPARSRARREGGRRGVPEADARFLLARHLEMVHFQHAKDRGHYAEGLRKAGLPE